MHRSVAIIAILILVSTAACSRVALDERFHDRRLTAWTIIDEPETVEGPSEWRVEEDGWLHQRSNVWGRRGDFLDRWFGTLSVAGDRKWGDYVLSVRSKPLDNDGFGFVFRFVDAEHFYRLLFIEGGMNGGPLTRLDKRVGPDYTELWSEKNGYRVGAEMMIEIEVAGDLIKASANGRRLFQVSDGSYDNGKVGLFCYAQSDQAFDDVRVSLR
jgi:hypothetical protein